MQILDDHVKNKSTWKQLFKAMRIYSNTKNKQKIIIKASTLYETRQNKC